MLPIKKQDCIKKSPVNHLLQTHCQVLNEDVVSDVTTVLLILGLSRCSSRCKQSHHREKCLQTD